MRQARINFSPYKIAPSVIPLAIRIAGGFLLGILIVQGFRDVVLNQVGYLGRGTLEELSTVIFQPRALLFYLLKQKFMLYGALLLVLMTAAGRLGMNLYTVGIGGLQGVFFMTAVLRYGMRGAALYVIADFPQILAFVPWLCLMYSWLRQERKIDFKGLLAGAFLLFADAWMQSYVNPFLLQKFLLKFFK